MAVILPPAKPKPPTIAERTRDAGGLLEVPLGELRAEIGYERLGPGVLDEIRHYLAKAKLGHFPASRLDALQNNEPRQWHRVWIYQRDNGVLGRVIDAVLRPDENDVRAALEGLVAGDMSALSADQKLERIREIVEAPKTVRLKQPKAS